MSEDEPLLAFHPGPYDVIMPGALGTEPVTVPLKDRPNGKVIGTCTVYPDGTMSGKITDGEAFEGMAFVTGGDPWTCYGSGFAIENCTRDRPHRGCGALNP